MTQKTRTWPLAEAREVAEDLITLLGSTCERIQVAGSMRRLIPMVGDIELLAISKTLPAYVSNPLSGAPLGYILLDTRVAELIAKGILDFRLNKRGSRTFGRWNKLLVHVPSGVPVDLFSTTEENWGMALLVRTGSAPFCVRVMRRLLDLGHHGHAYGGITLKSGQEVSCPTEEEVFQILGWEWIEPPQRE